MPETDYEKRQKAITEAIKTASKSSDNKILKGAAKEKENTEEKDKMQDTLYMLFHEMLDQIKEGDMKFAEAVDEFAEAAKLVDPSKGK